MVKIKYPGGTQTPEEMFPYDTDLICPACDCVFRLEPGDEWERHDSQFDGAYILTKCPQPKCRAQVYRDVLVSWSKVADPKWHKKG